MFGPAHLRLTIVRQCALVPTSRTGFYCELTCETLLNLVLIRLIDEQFRETPFYGARSMTRYFWLQGYVAGRKRTRCLMAKMGLTAISQKPRASDLHPARRTYRYLLRHLTIIRPNQVWWAEITYIQMRRGFLHLVAVTDRGAQGGGLAAVEHDGGRVPHPGAGESAGPVPRAGNLQH